MFHVWVSLSPPSWVVPAPHKLHLSWYPLHGLYLWCGLNTNESYDNLASYPCSWWACQEPGYEANDNPTTSDSTQHYCIMTSHNITWHRMSSTPTLRVLGRQTVWCCVQVPGSDSSAVPRSYPLHTVWLALLPGLSETVKPAWEWD